MKAVEAFDGQLGHLTDDFAKGEDSASDRAADDEEGRQPMAEEPPPRRHAISREAHAVDVQVRERELELAQAESD